MTHLKGEALNVGFDGSIKVEFHGSKVIPLCGNVGNKDIGKQAKHMASSEFKYDRRIWSEYSDPAEK